MNKNQLTTQDTIICAILGAITGLLILFITGCASAPKTGPTDQTGLTNAPPVNDRLTRVGNTLETAAYLAAGWHLIDNPEERGKIEKMAAALGSVVTAGSFIDVASKFAGNDDKGRLMVGGALLLFEQELSQLPKMEQPAFVKAVSGRFQKGLNRALGEAPAK